MSVATAPPPVKPTTAQIISSYALQPGEAEVVSCLLKDTDKLQNYWRARAALEELIKQEERTLA
ncbi:hypothetical protein CLV24_11426 [Pontibacter ummariensis]|uniref:Uncharacterized protein n=1 Tax=Pontibacter ummariensis TaxID=1610492 RepID=A0A239HN42_9BACT|nr:hypothetical protein [Pontibacter ummariensis]PRY10298.1 hypothetical protein CLV24_11426 [Pontibacter ummariensis]SNS81674.1 hypothetical protein SAMN06296052_11426 [Pontibacter ummariensis]